VQPDYRERRRAAVLLTVTRFLGEVTALRRSTDSPKRIFDATFHQLMRWFHHFMLKKILSVTGIADSRAGD
ncbi:MAG: hypothetical protein WAK55_20565, partial [Xanthobacteraceae bacterium]